MKAKSGGGPRMNKNVRPAVRTGKPSAHIVSPAGAAQQGAFFGKHADQGDTRTIAAVPLYRGTASQVRAGNDVAVSTVKGPGGSRTIYQRGTQALSGPVVYGEDRVSTGKDLGERGILGSAPKRI